jgi:hypothetical protein
MESVLSAFKHDSCKSLISAESLLPVLPKKYSSTA